MEMIMDLVWYLIGMFATLFFYVYIDKIIPQKKSAYISLFMLIFIASIVINYYVNELFLFLGIVVYASTHTTTTVLRVENE